MALQAEPQWITAPGLDSQKPVVLHFRREIEISQPLKSFPVQVSADNRFVLYVNGKRVAQGPARGDLSHWRYESVDIAAYLNKGRNVVSAEVWNAFAHAKGSRAEIAPLAQISARTGFWIKGGDHASLIESGPKWRVAIQRGHDFQAATPHLIAQLGQTFYAAGPEETIDGSQLDPDWNGPVENDRDGWTIAIPALAPNEKSPWTLVPDLLPQMSYRAVDPGKVVRKDIQEATDFPNSAVVIPARSAIHLLIDRGEMISAYPELEVSGGSGSKVTVTYSEALYDGDMHKGDRNEVANRSALGIADTFLPDGRKSQVFSPLWWRTWRYLDISVKTSDEQLVLQHLRVHAEGYPFSVRASFESNDPELNAIWEIGWRTLQIDAHETYMDSAYWEQLQYTGDTRIEALIAQAVSGDSRLTAQAIDAFGESMGEEDLTLSSYPRISKQSIPPFSLLWINMMHDYWLYEPDQEVLRRNVPRARKVLAWYRNYVGDNGLVKRTPGWNFVDWVGDPVKDMFKFPAFDAKTGTSCVVSLIYLGALEADAVLETAVGDRKIAKDARDLARQLRKALQQNCWDESRGLYADDPSKTLFSQHANALAVLYDVAPVEKRASILRNVTTEKGIDAPLGIATTSYYFSWYLIHAFEHAGLGDQYLSLLSTWKDLLKMHYTTWPETRGNTRSDTHAWSGHPTADLLGIVAGITPATAGYASVRIAPYPGPLKQFNASACTPSGMVQVNFESYANKIVFRVLIPEMMPGTFEWKGKSYELHPGMNKVEFSRD
jgi:hypothetical protein